MDYSYTDAQPYKTMQGTLVQGTNWQKFNISALFLNLGLVPVAQALRL